jgi:3-hydroxyisobutyrate dehydrogenase-like beta-hydroxyacid dehydrogenase
MSGPRTSARPAIALIGYGEVGQTLAADLRAAGIDDLVAWDRLFPEPASVPSRALADGHVRGASGLTGALRGRTLVISAVTAGECLAAAARRRRRSRRARGTST